MWWIALSALSMTFQRLEPMAALIALMAVSWISAKAGMRLVRFTLGLLPFLVIISIISLFPSMDPVRSIQMAVRYYVLLGSTTLVMATTSYGEITHAMRNLGRGRLRFLHKPIELFSLVFGLAFLTVPIAGEEWQSVKEVQRARGMDISMGGRVQQVRRGLQLIQPLILRILDRVRFFGTSIITLGYDPLASRTLYREMVMTQTDRVVLGACLGLMACGIMMRILFRI